ncbi:MAG: folate-binding protein, partial [Alphaproteobacteria bacterium]
MSACKTAELSSRAVICVRGADATDFLQNLVTNDVTRVQGGGAVHAGLLSPQGKILFDFLLTAAGDDGFLLDVRAEAADDLIKRLTFYRLRAKVELEKPPGRKVFALWDGEGEAAEGAVMFQDPRYAPLGSRLITGHDGAPPRGCELCAEAAYHAHRIACGVPEGGMDYAYGECFPHEADFDQLAGVDFSKGCYIGQEVVSRMQHRGTARKRIVPVIGESELSAGTPVTAEDSSIGTLGSTAGRHGLAMVRLDRAEAALSQGRVIRAGDVPIRLLQP